MNVEAVLADEVYSHVELGTYLTCMGDELPSHDTLNFHSPNALCRNY